MKNISKIKKRILEHIYSIGLNKRQFYIKTGIANGVLDKETGLTEENIDKYISTFPEISLEWLFRGKGRMLLIKKENNRENKESAGNNSERLQELKSALKDKERIIKMLEEENLRLKKDADTLETAMDYQTELTANPHH